MFSGNVDPLMTAPKPHAERQQTDGSLRDEREKTDRAIAAGRDLVQDSADAVLRRARAEADAVLEDARQKADRRREQSPATSSADAAVAIDRKMEDALVRADREAADQALALERVETARILARLLPAERDQTDTHLLAERVQSDTALANRDDFLGVVAHDLRDLLGGIVLGASVIGKVVGTSEHAAGVATELSRIQRHAARANRLIADLVDVASIDAGRLAMVTAAGDLQKTICEVGDEFRPSAAVKKIALMVEDDSIALPATFDHSRLLQVFGNLIANAIKFSPAGSRITLRAERIGNEVRCSVRDQGHGIPADQIENVFERFVQVDANDRRGLGLGLFIAKRIVEAHSGRIWADSTLGQGTSVLFTIPVQAA